MRKIKGFNRKLTTIIGQILDIEKDMVSQIGRIYADHPMDDKEQINHVNSLVEQEMQAHEEMINNKAYKILQEIEKLSKTNT